jgi:hypothetical protein
MGAGDTAAEGRDAHVTESLAKAFAEAARLPTSEQDRLADWLLEEIASEERWQRSSVGSPDALAKLADEALTEHRAAVSHRLIPQSERIL